MLTTSEQNSLCLSELTIEPTGSEHIDGLKLLNDDIYPYQWPQSFYVWQHIENVHPFISLVAVDDTSVVASFGIQKRQLTNGLSCGQVSWINVSEEYRGRGLFSHLAMQALERIGPLDAICVFANEAAMNPCRKSLAMEFHPVNTYVLCNKQLFLHPPNFSVMRADQIDYPFLKRRAASDIVQFNHDESFRQWRFSKSPVHPYHKVVLFSGEYAIIKLFIDTATGKKSGDIVDIECDMVDEQKLTDLLRAACAALWDMQADYISTWASHYCLRHALKQLGFENSGKQTYFGIHVYEPTARHLYEKNNWHLVMADASNY